MKQLTLIFLFFCISKNSYSQNGKFFIGEKVFEPSESFCIESLPSTIQLCKCEIFFAKNNGVNYLVFNSHFTSIKPPILIYLNDDGIIKIPTLFATDSYNSEKFFVFSISNEMIDKISNSNISAIRYSSGFSYNNFSDLVFENNPKYDFSKTVKEFFKL